MAGVVVTNFVFAPCTNEINFVKFEGVNHRDFRALFFVAFILRRDRWLLVTWRSIVSLWAKEGGVASYYYYHHRWTCPDTMHLIDMEKLRSLFSSSKSRLIHNWNYFRQFKNGKIDLNFQTCIYESIRNCSYFNSRVSTKTGFRCKYIYMGLSLKVARSIVGEELSSTLSKLKTDAHVSKCIRVIGVHLRRFCYFTAIYMFFIRQTWKELMKTFVIDIGRMFVCTIERLSYIVLYIVYSSRTSWWKNDWN